jgi:hypothetical protein
MKSVWTILLSLCCASAVSAETWHVDSERGDDARSGLVPGQAWRTLARLQKAELKPGDTVLLLAGSVWREPLLLTRSGSAGAPITVARGGKGAWPRIDAGGVAENAVEIRNADNIVLSGLEITNKGEGATLRRGVFVNEVDFGVASNVVLRDLYIHDVTGTNARKDNGGIVFSALGPNVPTRFEGVTIERNIVWRVDRSGIAGISDQVTVARWFPSRFVVIRDNVLEDIGGDGIVPRGTDGALIEHNIVRHAAARSGDYSAGVWQWSTDNSLIQLNEAAFTHGILDGQGFDSDYNSRRTTLVYNFSHDNEGGFLLLCTPVKRDAIDNLGNEGTQVRLNVSYNDRERIFQIAGASKALIERNVVHAGDGEVQMVAATWWDGWSQGIEFRNNWLGTRGVARYGYETGRSNGHYVLGDGFPSPLDLRFSGNIYAGGHANIPTDDTAKLRDERVARETQWDVPVLDPSKPDDLPDFLRRHRDWMMDMLAREVGHRPVLELPKLMVPEDWRRR